MKVVHVLSGKGGVGKTTVAVGLAEYLGTKCKTGLLDADLHGPDVLSLLGVSEKLSVKDKRIQPVRKGNLSLISFGGLIEDDQAVIWRGPLKFKAIYQLINDTDWGDIEYLIVDHPPGTGDELISAVQLLKEHQMGGLLVSTPQRLSLADLGRAVDFCRKMDLPVIGVVENMTGDVFGIGHVKRFCEEHDVLYLCDIPLDPSVPRITDSVLDNVSPIVRERISCVGESVIRWFGSD